MPGYRLLASPMLYPGQIVNVSFLADPSNGNPITVGLVIQSYAEADAVIFHQGPSRSVIAGETAHLQWQIPDLNGAPIVQVGLSISTYSGGPSEGMIHLDYLSWDGPPNVTFCRPTLTGNMWKRQWVNAADTFADEFGEAFRVIQNRGRGLVITGTREWDDYIVDSTITPHVAKSFGVAARVQGQERYYALLLSDRNRIKLIKRLDGETVLADGLYPWEFGKPYPLRLAVRKNQIQAWVDGSLVFQVDDPEGLNSGGIALVCEEGRIGAESVLVRPNPL
jgi:hypothetical protein